MQIKNQQERYNSLFVLFGYFWLWYFIGLFINSFKMVDTFKWWYAIMVNHGIIALSCTIAFCAYAFTCLIVELGVFVVNFAGKKMRGE